MQDLTPRQRARRIAWTAILLGVLLPVQALWFTHAPTPGMLAGRAAFGLLTGLLYSLAVIEVPYRVMRRGKDRPLARAARTGLPIAAMGAMMAMVMSGSSGTDGLFLLFVPLGVGIGLIAAGRASRIGDSRHCPKCDYEFAFADDDPDAPIRCPECGTGWLGRLAVGRRVRSRPLLGSGIAVIAATVLLVAGMIQGSGLSRMMPTPALIRWLGSSSTLTGKAAWAELSRRTLTPAQRGDLASRLLDVRLAGSHRLSVNGKQWLDAEVAAGTLPADVCERFFAEMFISGEIDAPRIVRVGAPFEVGLRHTDSNDGFAYKCYIYVGGFAVNNGPLAGRRTEGFYPNLIDRARRRPYTPLAEQLVAEAPGAALVRADLWLMVQTGFPADITWNDDGTPVMPPNAAWMKRLELSREIEVVP